MRLHRKGLARRPEEYLNGLDVAAVNLDCAEGRPGTPRDDNADECLGRLD